MTSVSAFQKRRKASSVVSVKLEAQDLSLKVIAGPLIPDSIGFTTKKGFIQI
jgi:hypothetical protein